MYTMYVHVCKLCMRTYVIRMISYVYLSICTVYKYYQFVYICILFMCNFYVVLEKTFEHLASRGLRLINENM